MADILVLLPSALRDNRIQLHRSTPTELSITISEVQLSDEGEYTCSLFTMPVRIARATVTVLGGSCVQARTQIEKLQKCIKKQRTSSSKGVVSLQQMC